MKLSKEFFKDQKQKVFLLGDNFFYGNDHSSQIISEIKKNTDYIYSKSR